MKSTTTVFTTTISSDLMNWMNYYAKAKKITKRFILEEAVLDFAKQQKKKELEESFRRASSDNEILEMAEFGLADYNAQLKRLEQ